MKYEDQLRDPRWQRRRLEVMQAADWKCSICGDENEELHVHHTVYYKEDDGTRLPPWDYRYTNAQLKCLCATCHTLTHTNERKVRAFAFALLISDSEKAAFAKAEEEKEILKYRSGRSYQRALDAAKNGDARGDAFMQAMDQEIQKVVDANEGTKSP